MEWGEYLCYGAQKVVIKPSESDLKKLVGRLEQALKFLGLSKFSSSIAVQFIATKLQSGEHDKFARAVQYLIGLLNNKSSTSSGAINDPRQPSIYKCPQIIPGLRAHPFWDTKQFPWIAQLEASYEDIKKEFIALRQSAHGPSNESGSSTTDERLGKGVTGGGSGFQHYRSPKTRNTKTTTKSNDNASHGNNDTTDNSPSAPTVATELGESATDRGSWNVCYFHLHGMDFADNLARCPLTAAAINGIPRQYHHALFSALAPDTHVMPHCGPTNKKLRCHLPLHIPPPAVSASAGKDGTAGGAASASTDTISTTSGGGEDVYGKPSNDNTVDAAVASATPATSWLRVGSEYCALQEGKCVLFDDSFEHEACNPSPSEPRVVLIIDVWHPDLSNEEVRRNSHIYIV